MKKNNTYMIFLIIVVGVNLLVNLYLFFRVRAIFPEGTITWWLAAVFFWLVAFSYVIGRFIERAGSPGLAEPFITVGSWWLGAMLYLTLSFILIDILRGLNGLFHVTELFRFSWLSSRGTIAVLLVFSLTAVILMMGYYNARMPVIRKVTVNINKTLPQGSQKIVLVSDIHLGMTISNGKLKKMVNLVNQQNPDLILLAGDVFDEDLGPVIQNNMGDLLKDLQARLGVYAILGNHEFYGNASAAEKYLENHRINVLRDSVAVLANGMTLVGREDLTYEQMTGKKRQPLKKLLNGVNHRNPVILMDHQPKNLQQAADHQIDLQVSGHTHNGQMWPFNYITEAVFEISSGYGQIQDTHYYVSSGYGTWGPPIRTNSRSEIVVLEMVGNRH